MGQLPNHQPDTPILRPYPTLFKNRNFLLLWAAYVISSLGDRIHFVIMLKLLSSMKNHAATSQDTAQLNIMMLAPFMLLGPFTGVIADRLPRRLIMISADLTRVVIVVVARTLFLGIPKGSPLLDPVPWLPVFTWAILLLLFSELLLGAFSALFSPARNALLPTLVHPDQLLRANSMTQAAGTIASLVGFLIAAVLVLHMNVALFADAGTFLCSALLLWGMKIKAATAPITPKKPTRGMLADFNDAIRYLRTHKRASQIIFLMFLFWCCGAIILSGLTGVVTNKFRMDESWFSTFLGIVGIGMMAGAASCSLARRGIPKEFGIAWCMFLVGIFFFLFSIPSNWLFALILLVICAFFGAILLVSLETLLQRTVPDYIRGRVMAVRDIFATIGMVGVAIPLAISSAIDNYIILILRIVAVLVMAVGFGLIVYYYRRQPMHAALAVAVRLCSGFLSVWHRFERIGPSRIPGKGPVIVVCNHVSGMDPIMLQISSPKRVIHFMMAKEFYEKKPLYWLFKALKNIPVNRTGTDIASFRTALRTLEEGGLLGIFPEGKITPDGHLQPGQDGVAMLVLKSGATVAPAAITGAHPHVNFKTDFLRRAHLQVRYGRPIQFNQYNKKNRDKETLDKITQAIMGAIAELKGEPPPAAKAAEAAPAPEVTEDKAALPEPPAIS